MDEKDREGFAAYVEVRRKGLADVVGVKEAQREAARPARRAARMGRSSIFESRASLAERYAKSVAGVASGVEKREGRTVEACYASM